LLKLSERACCIKPSATIAVTEKVREMKSMGINIVSFGPGESDFETPLHIKEAGIKAINDGFTRYTQASGITELKEAVCEKFLKDNNIKYEPSEIIISNGAKHSLYNALQAICDLGDEVIIPVPCWVTYPYIVMLAGGTPVFVYTSEQNNFRIDLNLLKEKITSKTKAIMINTPNNPTGSIYPLEDLEGIAKLAHKNHFYIITDEIYEKLIYDDSKHYSIASFGKEIKDLTITINGVSKSYAMTGWRIGFAAANKRIAKAMGNIQSQSTSNPNSIAQKAAIAALIGTQGPVDMMVGKFKRRRDVMVKKVNKIPNFSCNKPQGAFYVMGNISNILGKSIDTMIIENSEVFADLLLKEARVAVTPGSAFGPESAKEITDNFVRMSYATSMDNISEGMKRIQEFMKRI